MMVGAAGGGSGLNNLNFDSKNFQKIFEKKQETSSFLSIPNVLGTSTDATNQFFSQLFSSIPTYLYVVIGIEILSLVVVGITISLISSAWANAALFQGIQSAVMGRNVSIRDSSEKAFPSIKPLIKFSILTFLIFFAGILVLTIPIGIAVVINSTVLTIVMIILAVLSVVPLILLFVLAGVWAPRIIVFEKRPAWESFKRGFLIARKKFWASLGLGIVNTILAGIIIAVPILILAGIILALIFGSAGNIVNSPFIIPIAILTVVIFILVGLVSGILTAFKASVWTIAYNTIKGKYDKQ